MNPAAPRASPLGAPSVTHMKPSRSMKKPCGKFMIPWPKLLTNFPSRSTWMMGSSDDSAQPFAPQRSRIHRCLPSGSRRIPLATPILRPSSLSQSYCTLKGFCAATPPSDSTTAAAAPNTTNAGKRLPVDMTGPPIATPETTPRTADVFTPATPVSTNDRRGDSLRCLERLAPAPRVADDRRQIRPHQRNADERRQQVARRDQHAEGGRGLGRQVA